MYRHRDNLPWVIENCGGSFTTGGSAINAGKIN
jgi:hypothetical protein